MTKDYTPRDWQTIHETLVALRNKFEAVGKPGMSKAMEKEIRQFERDAKQRGIEL